jgi:hypothetical protein
LTKREISPEPLSHACRSKSHQRRCLAGGPGALLRIEERELEAGIGTDYGRGCQLAESPPFTMRLFVAPVRLIIQTSSSGWSPYRVTTSIDPSGDHEGDFHTDVGDFVGSLRGVS